MNNFEKKKNQGTYSGADSARELLSVGQFGKSGRECLSFLALFELTGTSPACCVQGNREPREGLKVCDARRSAGWKGDGGR